MIYSIVYNIMFEVVITRKIFFIVLWWRVFSKGHIRGSYIYFLIIW